MDRARYELPERLEILEHRFVGIVVMRRGVMHVGGDPHGVANSGMLDERHEIGELKFASERRTVALGNSLAPPLAARVVLHDAPSGISAAMIFQVAREFIRRRVSHAIGAGPSKEP